MYNQSYEEYMRSILGYPVDYRNTYETMNTYNPNFDMQFEPMSYTDNSELEDCYPEIYKLVYPMVTKACRENREPITRELIDRMTNEIYQAIEVDNNVEININLQNSAKSSTSTNRATGETKSEPVKENRSTENRQRRPGNRTLNDLIRILILREFIGRPGNFPFPRPRPRPGFPGGMGPGRPPFMPRDFEDGYMM